MILFAHAHGDVRSVLSVLRAHVRAETVQQKDSAGWHKPHYTIVKLNGDEGEIDAALAAAQQVGGVAEFQRHNVFIPGGPIAKAPRAEERSMKNLLQDLEEAKGGDAESLVRKLADAQSRMVDAIDKAQDVVSAQWDVVNSVSQQLTVQLKAPRVDGATVAELFKKYQIDVGDMLSSTLVDLIVARGGDVYPESYKPKRSRWALVER